MHAAHSLPKRVSLLTVPALADNSTAPSFAPARPAAETDKAAAAGFYLILGFILAALLLGVSFSA